MKNLFNSKLNGIAVFLLNQFDPNKLIY